MDEVISQETERSSVSGADHVPWLKPTMWQPGKSGNPAGRTKGSGISTRVREMIAESLDRLGGVDYLVSCGDSTVPQIRSAYLGLVKSIAPKTLEAEVGASLVELLSGSYGAQDELKEAVLLSIREKQAKLGTGDGSHPPVSPEPPTPKT